MQVLDLVFAEYVPIGQSSHALEPASENVPGKQSKHIVASCVGLKVPCGQCVHEDELPICVNVPREQGMQTTAFVIFENRPGGHSTQVPLDNIVPGEHGVATAVDPIEIAINKMAYLSTRFSACSVMGLHNCVTAIEDFARWQNTRFGFTD